MFKYISPATVLKVILVIFIMVFILFVVMPVFSESSSGKELDIGTVMYMAERGQLERIEVSGNRVRVLTRNNERFESRKESGISIDEMLRERGVIPGKDVQVAVDESERGFVATLMSFLQLILFAIVIIWVMRRASAGTGAGGTLSNIAKSKAKRFYENVPTVRFADVAGADEAIEELKEVAEFLKLQHRFHALGARIPKGVLLMGPPGTGKTLISRAVAGEAGVPFFSTSGSEFVEMFVGVGASRVRDLFDQARRNAPAIVFIDEIDAVGRHRGAGWGGGNDEREQTLNQILSEIDGFDKGTNVIVIAATNRPDILDSALLRPGRFDRHVTMPLPDLKGRKDILDIYLRGKPVSDVDVSAISRQTPGFSGADLANVVNEAAILAARKLKDKIDYEDFTEAVDRVVAGPAMKSRKMSEKEKEITAYHEAGHAVVAYNLPDADPVRKITIISRGVAGGYTQLVPEEDRHYLSKNELGARIAVFYGGQASEEIIFGDITTGASSDLQSASAIARKMVTEYGMSSLGRTAYCKSREMIFSGKEFSQASDYSEALAEKIDEEVGSITSNAYAKAMEILTKNKSRLIHIAKILIEVETLEGEALEKAFSADIP